MSAARGGMTCTTFNVRYFYTGSVVNDIGPRGRASDAQTLIIVWLRQLFNYAAKTEGKLDPIGIDRPTGLGNHLQLILRIGGLGDYLPRYKRNSDCVATKTTAGRRDVKITQPSSWGLCLYSSVKRIWLIQCGLCGN